MGLRKILRRPIENILLLRKVEGRGPLGPSTRSLSTSRYSIIAFKLIAGYISALNWYISIII